MGGSVCPNSQATLEKWCEQFSGIEQDAMQLVVNHHVYREVRNIIAANPTARQPSEFHGWMDCVYAAAAVAGVGRLIDPDRRSVSLRNLLSEIKDNSRLISVDRYVQMHAESNPSLPAADVADMAKGDFERSCGSSASYLPANTVEADIQLLDDFTRLIKKYRNRRVAHKDRRSFNNSVTYGDLEKAISCIEKLVLRYKFFLEGEEWPTLLPHYQYNWKQIFRAPWLEG